MRVGDVVWIVDPNRKGARRSSVSRVGRRYFYVGAHEGFEIATGRNGTDGNTHAFIGLKPQSRTRDVAKVTCVECRRKPAFKSAWQWMITTGGRWLKGGPA